MGQMHRYDLRIADLVIRMELDHPINAGEAFSPFMTREAIPDVTAVFRQVEALAPIPEEMVYEDVCFRVHPAGNGRFIRSFFYAPRDLTPYGTAVYDTDGRILRVDYLEKGRHCVSDMANSFFHLGIEDVMLRRRRVFLHAACVQTCLGGILFSGPSGVGKSTQARLWQTYRGSRLINGDRTILSKQGDTWWAWGSPYAGSSRCYVNAKVPVRATVLLEQGPRCMLRRLGPGEAFRKLYAGMTLNSWNRAHVLTACDLASELAGEIPVYTFTCTAEEAAVDYLEKALQGADIR